MTRIVIFGKGAFAAAVADRLTADGHRLLAVVAPARRGDDWDTAHLWADRHGLWLDADRYHDGMLPEHSDLIIAAHSHNFIGRRTRARATYSVGYHPSLLPVHRGRDAIRWTIRDRDPVTGGTVYHLTDTVDGGPIAAQQHVLVPRAATASSLWRERLFPLGVDLLAAVAAHADAGTVGWTPQEPDCGSWEPSWEREPLHRPELPELTAAGSYRPAQGVWTP